MDKKEKRCPECSGIMESGELLDVNLAITNAQRWTPSAGSFLGIGTEGIKIVSYRCIDCGYIINYAPSEKRKKEIKKLDEKYPNRKNLPFGYEN